MANLFAVPKFVKARSPLGLRRLMLRTQMQDKMQYNFDIKFAEGEWFAWYFWEPKNNNQKLAVAKELALKESEIENGI